nr:reverse transcriptase domain-containing protein [Tanacetum cinerariifolium]
MGSRAPRVILFGDIPAIIPVIPKVPIIPVDPLVAPEMGTVSVVLLVGVLDLVDYSSSFDSDPSKDSLPPVPDLPLVLPSGSSSHDTLAPSSKPSRKRYRSLTALVLSSTHDSRSIAPILADLLPPRKRFRDSYSLEDSREEQIEVDTADAEAVVDVGISDGVVAHTRDGVGMRVEITASDVREDDEEFEAEASAADTRKITIDPWITEIETTQRQLEASQLVASRERASLVERIGSLRLEYLKRSLLADRDVPNDVIKLMMFPYSLEGNARVWYDKEPFNSILTWEDLVNKFVNQFFPPSKTTHLKNEISRFTQRFEETFGEAWKRFKEMLRACPHHGFMELVQIDTFYNGLNDNDQDSLNAASGGNLLIDIFAKKVVTPAPVKAVEESCVTCGGVVEDVFIKVGKFHFPTDFVVVDFEADPCVPLILGRSFLRTSCALIDIYGEEITLRVNDEAVTFNLNQTTRYSSTYDDLSVNHIDIINVVREKYAQEILGFSNNSLGGNPTLTFKPILSDSSPSLTPFEGSDFILEEIEAYLKDESILLELDNADWKITVVILVRDRYPGGKGEMAWGRCTVTRGKFGGLICYTSVLTVLTRVGFGKLTNMALEIHQSVVDLTGDEDPSDEDGGTRMDDSTGVSVSLGEISLEGNKSWESNIGKKTSMSKRYLVKSFEESVEMLPRKITVVILVRDRCPRRKAVPLDGLHFDDKLHFVEEPMEIVGRREVKRLKRSRIPLVKVRWNSKRGDTKRELRVSCYTDAGYLTDADDMKSQTGYVFVLNRGDVDWKSTKQSIFATSSTGAEYIAAFDASKEAVWI